MERVRTYDVNEVSTVTARDVEAFRKFYNTVKKCRELFGEDVAVSIQEFAGEQEYLIILNDAGACLNDTVNVCLQYAFQHPVKMTNLVGYTFNMKGEAVLFINGINQEERAEEILKLENKYKEAIFKELSNNVKIDLFEAIDGNVNRNLILSMFDILPPSIKLIILDNYISRNSK